MGLAFHRNLKRGQSRQSQVEAYLTWLKARTQKEASAKRDLEEARLKQASEGSIGFAEEMMNGRDILNR